MVRGNKLVLFRQIINDARNSKLGLLYRHIPTARDHQLILHISAVINYNYYV